MMVHLHHLTYVIACGPSRTRGRLVSWTMTGVWESISSPVRSEGFWGAVFPSAEDFLAAKDTNDTKYLILDVRMPPMSGLELQTYLETKARPIPIIFASGYPDQTVHNKALDRGAVAFLYKPFGEAPLFEAMRVALGENGPPA